MALNYRLVCLTHGTDRSFLERTLRSFKTQVGPRPSETLIVHDGPPDALPRPHYGRRVSTGAEPIGYCAASGFAYEYAARDDYADWVFYLEHDFLFTRPVDLEELAAVMDAEPHVAQMALIRQPIGREIEHGGFIGEAPGFYRNRETLGHPWVETTRNWTGNPSLFRPSFMREHPWPTETACEGKFGAQVRKRAPDTTFGLWGDGEPWIEHVGGRDQHSFGY